MDIRKFVIVALPVSVLISFKVIVSIVQSDSVPEVVKVRQLSFALSAAPAAAVTESEAVLELLIEFVTPTLNKVRCLFESSRIKFASTNFRGRPRGILRSKTIKFLHGLLRYAGFRNWITGFTAAKSCVFSSTFHSVPVFSFYSSTTRSPNFLTNRSSKQKCKC